MTSASTDSQPSAHPCDSFQTGSPNSHDFEAAIDSTAVLQAELDTRSNDDLKDDATALIDVIPQSGDVDLLPDLGDGHSPTQLGPYVLEREIGRGAMGVVYEASHKNLKRKVALKILPAGFHLLPARLNRFQREMEAIGRLDHENIVRATDAGEFEGVHFLAMDLVHGIDLGQLVKQAGPLDIGSACEAVRQTALGLQHIYENKLVHRDIKPSNLLLTDDGLIKILDLGIAMLRHQDGDHGQTSIGAMMGTPDFIAPEQVEETRDVDIRADIYSVGCTLYTLLAGAPPFDGPQYGTQMAKLIAHGKDAPPPITSKVPNVPPELAEVIDRMTAKQPSDRFQTPIEVVNAVAPWADGSQLFSRSDISIEQASRRGSRQTKSDSEDATLRPGSRAAKPRPSILTATAIVATVVVVLGAAAGLPMLNNSTRPATATVPSSSPLAPEDAGRSGVTNNRIAVATNPQEHVREPSQPIVETSRSVADDTRQIREDTHQLADSNASIQQNTQRIADTIVELRVAFQAAARDGGLVNDAKSAGELYHNARVYGQQGDYSAARRTYIQLFELEVEFVDVHRSFQQFLKLQEGLAGAREVYRGLPGNHDHPVRLYAQALLEEPSERESQLTSLISRETDFAPAFYELGRCFSSAVLGTQSLADKAREKQLIERFLDLQNAGHLLRYFLDQSDVASMIDDARQRLTKLETIDPQVFERPVTLSFYKQPDNWSFVVQLAETAREIRFRMNENEEFQLTGFSSSVNSVTGAPNPKTIVNVPRNTPRCDIQIQYVDIRGNTRGPYFVPFDPADEGVRDAKRKLNQMTNTWVKFGKDQYRGRLFFTRLAVYKDAISEVRYAIDDDEPRQIMDLPQLDQGNMSNLSVIVPPSARFAVVQVSFHDGTKSDIARIDRD